MAVHLCDVSKQLTWEAIKKSILGLKNGGCSFTCGGCGKKFETICCLHIHCIKHNEGGSYYFDHITKTAFPRYDTACSYTQLDSDSFHTVCDSDRVIKCESRSIFDSMDQHADTSSDVSVLKKDDINEPVKNIGPFHHVEPEVSESMTDTDKSVSLVKVRNVTKSSDGSIFFEMDEKDVHLSDKTAEKVLEELNKLGGELPCQSSELQVFVSVPVENKENNQLPPSCQVREAATSLNNDNRPSTCISSVQKKEIDKSIDEHEDRTSHQLIGYCRENDLNINPKNENDNTYNLNIDSEIDSDKTNNLTIFSKVDVDKTDDLRCVIIQDNEDNDLNTSKTECEDKKGFGSSVDERSANFDDCTNTDQVKCDDEIVKTFDWSGNKYSASTNISIADPETSFEISKQIRSTRKRKLTSKMKESLFAKSMFLISDYSRNDNDQCDRKERHSLEKKKVSLSKKPGKTNKSFEADICASEALLSLSETNSSSEKKIANKCKIGKYDVHGERKATCNISVINEVSVETQQMDEHAVKENDAGNVVSEDVCTTQKESQNEHRMLNDELKHETDNTKQQSGENVKIEVENLVCNDNEEDDDEVENVLGGDNDDDDFVPKLSRRPGKVPMKNRHDLVCHTCGKVGTVAMVKYHEQMHSSNKKFTCNECGKTLKTAACLRSHMQIHGEKKWKCDLCPAAFFRKAYLETHKTNHSGVYPFSCDLCGMKFKMSYILRRHVNCVHKNIRQFECDICQRRFFRGSTRDHHRIRHFDPSLKCTYCPKMFKTDLDLRKHELTHTGEKLFFCPLCNHGFSQIWPYYKHMWGIHQIQKEEAKQMKISNPDIKNMRKLNRNPNTINSGGNAKSDRSNNSLLKNNKDQLNVNTDTISSIKVRASNLFGSDIEDSNFGVERSELSDAIYSRPSGDITDTVVLDIRSETLDVNNTVVIQSEDIHSVDSSTGYIVVDDGQVDGNIVVFSEFQESEIEKIVSDCPAASL